MDARLENILGAYGDLQKEHARLEAENAALKNQLEFLLKMIPHGWKSCTHFSANGGRCLSPVEHGYVRCGMNDNCSIWQLRAMPQEGIAVK